MSVVVDGLSWILLFAGGAVTVIGSVGLVRFPDFFTRMHAASVTDTGGVGLLVFGLLLQAGWTQVGLKLVLICLLLLFTGPVATHALAKAAIHGKLEPWRRQDAGMPSSKP